MAVTTLLGLPIPSMSETVGKTIPDLASAMQIIDEKLGGSRIVDHNLDVVAPPNGYYWRTEDGRQVCWREGSVSGVTPYSETVQGLTLYRVATTATYAAKFSAPPVVTPPNHRLVLGATAVYPGLNTGYTGTPSTTSVTLVFESAKEFDGVSFWHFIAIGRWK